MDTLETTKVAGGAVIREKGGDNCLHRVIVVHGAPRRGGEFQVQGHRDGVVHEKSFGWDEDEAASQYADEVAAAIQSGKARITRANLVPLGPNKPRREFKKISRKEERRPRKTNSTKYLVEVFGEPMMLDRDTIAELPYSARRPISDRLRKLGL